MAVKSRGKRKISPQAAPALWDLGVRWNVNVISKRMYENKQSFPASGGLSRQETFASREKQSTS